MPQAVLLDRDGVLNRLIERGGKLASPRRAEEFSLLDGAAEAVQALSRAGLRTIVVTNQPEIARGGMSADDLRRMHERLRREVRVDAIYFCPHDDADQCSCRKPKPGMLLRAAEDWNLNLGGSFLVGDSAKDVAAGRAAGCTTILCGGTAIAESPDARVADLPAAARWILSMLNARRNPVRRAAEKFSAAGALR